MKTRQLIEKMGEEKFLEEVNKRFDRKWRFKTERLPGSTCILWTGSRQKDGFGRVIIHGVKFNVSRLVLMMVLGRTLKENEAVVYTCGNQSCISPRHLRLGKTSDGRKKALS